MPTTPPPVLIVGPVTLDHFVDGADARRDIPGGAVSYAARAATALGQRLAILTIGGPDANIDALAGHDACRIQTDTTLTFELSHADAERELRVLARPNRPLRASDLPSGWERARLLILAPLLPDDIDIASFAALDAPHGRAIVAQGLQRRVEPSSAVSMLPHPSSTLLRHCSPDNWVFLSYDETSPWSRTDHDAFVRRPGHLVVTRGADGADIYSGAGAPLHVDACPARAVDTTGAGDVFAAVFMLSLHEGQTRAARLASAYAAAAVEVAGAAPLPGRAQLLARLERAVGVHDG
jgi:sugar/nucleoside kinase (ribokinase family)